jgi:putative transposase
VLGERHVYCVIQEYVGYFNQARPHQGLGQKIPRGPATPPNKLARGKIVAFPVLGGLHHYQWAA